MRDALCCCLALLAAAPAAAEDFSAHWHDGRAEMDGYRLTIARYGEMRSGRAVMIYVTEPFSEVTRVKIDRPQQRTDAVDVLKLNFVRDFQTGIYDYNTMTSVFAASRDFAPLKVTFSSAEWCGHVYEELLFDPHQVRETVYSYFENESQSGAVERKDDAVSEDNLYILLRGLRGAYLEPGRSRRVSLLPGALHRRLRHQPINWIPAEVTRLAETETVEVPAGVFETMVYVVEVADGRTGRFHVEREYPHRIVRWAWSPGRVAETGELTGSIRVKYWQLNANEDERYLEELGLGPPPR